MHRICHTINQIGGDARLVFLHGNIVLRDEPSWVNPEWNTPSLSEDDRSMLQTETVMYPEIISGNPLCASKVVRYLGNKDGLLTGKKMNAKPEDFLLAHSKMIEPNANCVLFNAFFNPVFNNVDTFAVQDRDFDATYIGKGFVHGRGFPYGDCRIMPETLLIERTWPRGAEQLSYVLRRTRFFHTWDSWTATNVEAILCGAVPFFLRYEPWTEAEVDGSELGLIPRLDEKNPHFDAEKFHDGRQRLVKNIDQLNATWDNRAREFLEKVQAHFGI